MQIKSKFRKLFWIRIGIGLVIFILAVCCCFNCISDDSQNLQNPMLIGALFIVLFLLYLSVDLFTIFKLIITEDGIEKISLIFGRRQFIPFVKIINIKREKITLRSKTGNISDGYYFSIVRFENNKSLTISPDHFKNYEEIMSSIKSKLNYL